MSCCCVHPIASVPKDLCIRLCIRRFSCLAVLCICIANFPCTILQVVIVLNFNFFRDSYSHTLYTLTFLTFLIAQVRWTTSSSSCLRYVAGGGEYFIVVLVCVHSVNSLIYAVAWLKKKLSVFGCLALKYRICLAGCKMLHQRRLSRKVPAETL